MNQHFVSLQTTAIKERAGTDRPAFDARLTRTFGASKPYQVFCSTGSMLFLPITEAGGTTETSGRGAIVAGAVLGGMMGAMLGGMIADNLKTTSVGPLAEKYNLCTDDKIIELARQRKGSMLSEYADIISVNMEGPSFSDRMFSSSKLVGNITIRDRTIGKLVFEITSVHAMLTAIQALRAKLGDRVHCRLEWCDETHSFVSK